MCCFFGLPLEIFAYDLNGRKPWCRWVLCEIILTHAILVYFTRLGFLDFWKFSLAKKENPNKHAKNIGKKSIYTYMYSLLTYPVFYAILDTISSNGLKILRWNYTLPFGYAQRTYLQYFLKILSRAGTCFIHSLLTNKTKDLIYIYPLFFILVRSMGCFFFLHDNTFSEIHVGLNCFSPHIILLHVFFLHFLKTF